MCNKRRFGFADEQAFSLVEVVISCGLIALALSASLCILVAAERVQGRMVEHNALTTIVDNLATDIQSAVGYNGNMSQDVHQGVIPANFSVAATDAHGPVQCAATTVQGATALLILSCRGSGNTVVQRIVHLAAGAPAPGSVVTAAPTAGE